jgi:polyhydroxyalkanoate synthesis regulator protein
MQEQTRKNLEIFQNALNMFAPFTAFEQKKPGVTDSPKNAVLASPEKKTARAQTDEIAELKTQLASIQLQLNKLADQNK